MSIFQTSKVLGYENDKVLGPTGGTAIPEFGTTFVRGMLEDTQPNQFDILVRLSGFSHGTDVWLGNAKDPTLRGFARDSQNAGITYSTSWKIPQFHPTVGTNIKMPAMSLYHIYDFLRT